MPKPDALTVIEQYKSSLDEYTLEQLRYKSEEDVWSIGQMYDHVIGVAEEYIGYIRTCASATGEEQPGGKSADGTRAFEEKMWPHVRVKLNEPVNATRNPESKDELTVGFEHVLRELKDWASHVHEVHPAYKVRHGWFGWLDAREWFELVGMHSRHHLRQKAELDQRLAEAGLR
ncbi:DinB family protein [uncultured Paenibacillus sp.]|uniref:DinB family protein n=1 Tax=uncultured Paenibacillus sp. TaxID=227322 RepID=UPI0015AB7FE9|nr:DinB family protein [uncultured Paenibacillus sp.]